jgi:hypothetical protein
MEARDARARQPNLTVRSILWTADNIGDYVDPDQREYTFDTIPLVRDGGS